ncbi:MAG: class I SAM-dependent methyltransferase [Candidatus Limnocylindrales bacterium]
MSFDVAAEAYDRFMGLYSVLLAPQMADLAGLVPGQRVIDVGCGPGALTGELVARVGAAGVAAVDPSAPFVEAAEARHAGVDVRQATAEALPFDDDAFDAALAQLVVHFMADPVAGIREMRRVTRPGGVVVACVWDHAGGQGPLGLFWRAARELDPGVHDESGLAGAREGHLAELFAAAGLRDIHETTLVADLEHPHFDAWWEPFTRGVGPAGAYVAKLDPDAQAALRERCREGLPDGPFVIPARAWATRGHA